MLFAIGRNINKYHRFLHAKLKKFEGKIQEKIAQENAKAKYQPREVMPENRQHYRKTKYPDKVTKPKRLVFVKHSHLLHFFIWQFNIEK